MSFRRKLFVGTMVLAALAAVVFAWLDGAAYREFSKAVVRQKGNVIAVTIRDTPVWAGFKRGYKIRPHHYPRVEFQTPDGRTHRFESTYGAYDSQFFSVGQQVEVLYPPSAPFFAEIKYAHLGYSWSPYYLFLAACLLFVAWGSSSRD